MIIGFFLNIINTIILYIINKLPVYDTPAQMGSSILLMWNMIQSYSYIFPVVHILIGITIITLFYLVVFGWDIGIWVIHLFRGK